MKTNNITNQKVFLKSILILLLTIIFSNNSIMAQVNPCGCKPTSSILTTTVEVGGSGTGNFITVEFTMVQCDPNVGIIFNKATGFSTNPPYTYAGPNFILDYRAIQEGLLAQYGAGANMAFTYPAACQAVAEITYPPVTCYTFALEGPLAGQGIQYPLNRVLQSVDCDGESCCMQNWIFDPSTYQYQLEKNNPVMLCDASNPPPMGSNYTMTCQDRSGAWVTYTGALTSIIAPCYSFCDPGTLSTMFTTTSAKEFKAIQPQSDIKVSPIPANNHITFSEIKNIKTILVFDINGKKVLEQAIFDGNKIDISLLTKGIYFVKVFFKDASLRTIKIIKE
jgi:hypothetical protein